MDEMITTTAAGKELGVSGQTVRQMIAAGYLEAIRTPGGHFRVKASSVKRLAETYELSQTVDHDIKPQ